MPAFPLVLFACAHTNDKTPTRTFETQYGCLVVNAPTANTVAAAEHGIALMCAMSRNVPQADSSMKAGQWERTKYVGVSLVQKTLAIIGYGKVCVWGGACVGGCVIGKGGERPGALNMP